MSPWCSPAKAAPTLLDQPTYDTGRVAQALNKLGAGYGTASVPAALDYAAGVFGQMHESARNLVVLTDFQRISFPTTEDSRLGESIARLKALPSAPTITFFDVGSEVKDNVAIESLDFSRLMVGVGQKIQIRANLRNFGEAAYPDLRVFFRADGKERAVSQIRARRARDRPGALHPCLRYAGSHVIEVFADADPLKADNVFLAEHPVRDKVPLLLVQWGSQRRAAEGRNDFAEIALQPTAPAGSSLPTSSRRR
jgi:hypothetical protein